MRESRDACAASILGVAVFFLLFGSKREEGKTGETARKDFVVPFGCDSCRIEDANFLVLYWFKRELSFNLYFSCLAIQGYRVAAVCFLLYSRGRSL